MKITLWKLPSIKCSVPECSFKVINLGCFSVISAEGNMTYPPVGLACLPILIKRNAYSEFTSWSKISFLHSRQMCQWHSWREAQEFPRSSILNCNDMMECLTYMSNHVQQWTEKGPGTTISMHSCKKNLNHPGCGVTQRRTHTLVHTYRHRDAGIPCKEPVGFKGKETFWSVCQIFLLLRGLCEGDWGKLVVTTPKLSQ